jgi:cell division protease FtsH
MGMSATVISPDKLKGSMDDLIGMEDIKQEVLHLEDMIRNRASTSRTTSTSRST